VHGLRMPFIRHEGFFEKFFHLYSFLRRRVLLISLHPFHDAVAGLRLRDLDAELVGEAGPGARLRTGAEELIGLQFPGFAYWLPR